MAWYAKFDGVDGSTKDGASNTLLLAEMDSFKFLPEKEDEVLVAFEFGDKDLDATVARTNKPSLVVKFDIGGAPSAPEHDQYLGAVDDDAGKPSLVVKLDIGGPPLSVLE